MKMMMVLLFHLCLQIVSASYENHDIQLETRKLVAGVELFAEKLPLQMGRCIYELEGLEASKWYEVKISYPASLDTIAISKRLEIANFIGNYDIPASFSIKLFDQDSLLIAGGRRLLNTEKFTFSVDENQNFKVVDGMVTGHVLVSAEPAGVLAQRHAKEQPFVIYNILCEEVRYGIPLQAYWIGCLGLIAILASFVLPSYLPPDFLSRRPFQRSKRQAC